MRLLSNPQFVQIFRCYIWCMAFYLIGPGAIASATAAESTAKKPPTVSPYIYTQLNLAQQQFDSGLPEKALLTLNSILKQQSSSPYEKALAQQTSGLIYYQQQQIDQAIEQFKLAIDSEALPLPTALHTRYNLAQLYLFKEQYRAAIETLKRWFQLNKEPTAHAYLLLASAYSATHQYNQAIKPAELAIESSTEPLESHYRFLLGLYFETENQPRAIRLLEKLILKFPANKEYWLQLASLYSLQNREQDSLAITEMAYQRQLLDRSEEIIGLARLLLHLNNPHKAAQILEREMNAGTVEKKRQNQELLARAWFNAREYRKALQPLELAAEQSSNGQLYFRLAQAQFELENYQNAIDSLKSALSKGSLQETGEAHLLHGIALYQLDMPDQAMSVFEQAAKFNATQEQANRWIKYLQQD